MVTRGWMWTSHVHAARQVQERTKSGDLHHHGDNNKDINIVKVSSTSRFVKITVKKKDGSMCMDTFLWIYSIQYLKVWVVAWPLLERSRGEERLSESIKASDGRAMGWHHSRHRRSTDRTDLICCSFGAKLLLELYKLKILLAVILQVETQTTGISLHRFNFAPSDDFFYLLCCVMKKQKTSLYSPPLLKHNLQWKIPAFSRQTEPSQAGYIELLHRGNISGWKCLIKTSGNEFLVVHFSEVEDALRRSKLAPTSFPKLLNRHKVCIICERGYASAIA